MVMVDEFLDSRVRVLSNVNDNFRLIKDNSKTTLIMTENIKDKLVEIRKYNQAVISNTYLMTKIDNLASLLSDLLNANELIDLMKELKNVRQPALEMIDNITASAEEIKASNPIKSAPKKKRWVLWKKKA